ncbi:MAG: hypothetical protein WC773_04540 [Patescibacteria group bacterium]|jgi:hypothetical protein
MKQLKHKFVGAILLVSLLVFPGCSILSPELIEALSKDTASLCALQDIRGGAGAIIGAAGGYGQGTLSFCRSNYPDALVTLKPDGSISIQHGKIDAN